MGEGVGEDPEELEHEDGWHEALAEQGAVSAIVVLVEPVARREGWSDLGQVRAETKRGTIWRVVV